VIPCVPDHDTIDGIVRDLAVFAKALPEFNKNFLQALLLVWEPNPKQNASLKTTMKAYAKGIPDKKVLLRFANNAIDKSLHFSKDEIRRQLKARFLDNERQALIEFSASDLTDENAQQERLNGASISSQTQSSGSVSNASSEQTQGSLTFSSDFSVMVPLGGDP